MFDLHLNTISLNRVKNERKNTIRKKDEVPTKKMRISELKFKLFWKLIVRRKIVFFIFFCFCFFLWTCKNWKMIAAATAQKKKKKKTMKKEREIIFNVENATIMVAYRDDTSRSRCLNVCLCMHFNRIFLVFNVAGCAMMSIRMLMLALICTRARFIVVIFPRCISMATVSTVLYLFKHLLNLCQCMLM